MKKARHRRPLHTKEPVTVASFRTWRGWRENVARNQCLTLYSIKRSPNSDRQIAFMSEPECPTCKELKDRETRAHAAWTVHLYRNEVKPKLSEKAKRKHQKEEMEAYQQARRARLDHEKSCPKCTPKSL